MKFLADMGISPKSVAFLQSMGYDARHLNDEGLNRLADSDILNKARYEERIVLTHDLDFSELLAVSGEEMPSVIIFRVRNMHPERVNDYLNQIIVRYRDALEKGCIVSITENQLRIRFLPMRRD
jgi:predicted nuclease of predicted toxin-antitoxin system